MKTNLKLYYITGILIILLYSIPVNAQQKATKTKKDTSSTRMAADMAISKSRAIQIKSALNYRHEEISQLMKDSSMSPAEKHLRFKRMVMDQRRKIDSVTTPAERQKLKQVYGAITPEHQAQLDKMRQRQESEMNRVLHRQIPANVLKDSVHVLLKPTN